MTFKSWLGEPHWVKRFAAAGKPGAYLRVLTEGTVQAGDDLTVAEPPGPGRDRRRVDAGLLR